MKMELANRYIRFRADFVSPTLNLIFFKRHKPITGETYDKAITAD